MKEIKITRRKIMEIPNSRVDHENMLARERR
jgi:hypothetical protein